MHSQNIFHQQTESNPSEFSKENNEKKKYAQKIQRQKNNAEKRSESDVFRL